MPFKSCEVLASEERMLLKVSFLLLLYLYIFSLLIAFDSGRYWSG